MSIFGGYSKYYDLLYQDKDYAGEVDYVIRLLKQYARNASSLLELGCGTGHHAALLVEQGYTVHGIDNSESMLGAAAVRRDALPAALAGRLRFSRGDVCTFRIDTTFDAVLSLFHVVSYQTGNNDLIAMFKNVASHLNPGGIFVFDYWYGPSVLTDRPSVRVKRMASEEIAVTRIAEPVMHPEESIVDVNYHVFIRDLASAKTEELHETHHMRYLFSTEVDFLARQTGMRVVNTGEWLTGKMPGWDTWGVCSVLTK